MTTPSLAPPRRHRYRGRWGSVLVALVTACSVPLALAQAPAATATVSEPLRPEELEPLVARIALYPDDLVAVILPASTNPLQIVQADRFLDKRKADPKLPVDEKWDDAVKTLLNYPEVVKTMSSDLDWTAALGEAVVTDQGAVLDAVQAFRRKTQSAGNLKTDEKQKVVVEKEIIKIESADPQVIYVPQYNPTTVVVSGYAGWGYYPPYPSYYYPYPPGAALATGLVWGAAIGAIWGGNHYSAGWGGNNNININRNTNINTGDINVGNRGGNRGGTTQQWNSGKTRGQVSSSVGRTPSSSARVGDSRAGGGAGAGSARASTQGGVGAGAGGATRDRGATASSRDGGGFGGGGGGSSFDGYGSGRQTQMDSSRGASSRGASASSRPSHSAAGRGGGGGGRAGGGGGGRRR